MKTLVTIMALSLATAFSANAQTTKKVEKSTTETNKVQPQQDLYKQIQTQTERMTKDLDLSAEQVDQVMSENKMLYSNMNSIAVEDVNSADYTSASNRAMANYDKNLKNILDESQYGTYQNMKADYMKGFNTNKATKVSQKK